ncbi:DUF1028 domain-containing protein [Aquimarina sp. Aq78]|uniref:DUF1028 domain-containing protein n=1 Tax=Aquimarina sp. Aq78 TaxID=1191889 RepID=UPI000D0F8D20|nr:DUF1028 domain-containing protein [Aquimarina sp. Aq78]
MKTFLKPFVIIPCVFFFVFSSFAQHTFSIVAVDPITGEIGSAGATCIASEDGAQDISAIVLGIGAIHTQSAWDPRNQANATKRMKAGDSPAQIINWLVANDVNNSPSARQYNIVDLNNGCPRSAAYTGPNCFKEFIHITGPNYAIAGNILISEDVVKDMETAFLNCYGSLADKLMAALQGAKRPGADSRCLNDGISSASAFIRVADPSDTDSSYGNLSLDLNVWITTSIFEPIDALQNAYNATSKKSNYSYDTSSNIIVFPNPSNSEDTIIIKSKETIITSYEILNAFGKVIDKRTTMLPKNNVYLDAFNHPKGIYFVNIYNGDKKIGSKKILIE